VKIEGAACSSAVLTHAPPLRTPLFSPLSKIIACFLVRWCCWSCDDYIHIFKELWLGASAVLIILVVESSAPGWMNASLPCTNAICMNNV